MHYARALDWRPALRLAEFIAVTYGLPAMIAARAYISAVRAASLSQWIGTLERAVRAMILQLAASMPDFKAHGARWPALPPSAGGRSVASFHSEEWQVGFRFAPTTRSAKQRARNWRTFPHMTRSSMPLAERFEAVIRVLADPERYARRYKSRHRNAPTRQVPRRPHAQPAYVIARAPSPPSPARKPAAPDSS